MKNKEDYISQNLLRKQNTPMIYRFLQIDLPTLNLYYIAWIREENTLTSM